MFYYKLFVADKYSKSKIKIIRTLNISILKYENKIIDIPRKSCELLIGLPIYPGKTITSITY